jgi:hypothetical protein
MTIVIWQAGPEGPKIDEIPVSRVGIDLEGTLSIQANGPDGEAFTLQVKGTDSEGRSLVAALRELAANITRHTGVEL